jgi:hypothetical protein
VIRDSFRLVGRFATVLLAVLIAAALALFLAGAQLLIPRIAERRVRQRLLAGGGEAEVRIRAMPATKLLRNRGDLIAVRGRGLVIGIAEPPRGDATVRPAGLTALDGFAEVDLELVDFRSGPFAVEAFVLSRAGSSSYAMATRARTTPAELAGLGLDWLPPIPGGGLLGTVAGSVVGRREIPLSVELELISEKGELRVGTGGGSIAGYPAGPLATTIAAAVARRLEIVP